MVSNQLRDYLPTNFDCLGLGLLSVFALLTHKTTRSTGFHSKFEVWIIIMKCRSHVSEEIWRKSEICDSET